MGRFGGPIPAASVVPTITHWDAFRPRLESEGVDIRVAEKQGQLTIVDADNLDVAKSKAGKALVRAIEAAVIEGDFVLVD